MSEITEEEIKNEKTEGNTNEKCFEPLYPPGKVLWIIGGDYKPVENTINKKEIELININKEDTLKKELVLESK